MTAPLILRPGWGSIPNRTGLPGAEVFANARLRLVAIRSRDMGRWHLSVSHADRVPTWGEVGEARDALLPTDVWMMIPHPPRKYWLNLNPRVLHLWEFRDALLIKQFCWEGEAAQAIGAGSPDTGDAR